MISFLHLNKYGLLKQSPDFRDIPFVPVLDPSKVKSKDLKHWFNFTYDQLRLGSCTSNGTLEAIELVYAKNNDTSTKLSRLFQYYNSRLTMGLQYVMIDSGATIRDAIKAYNKYGCCLESDWTYTDNQVKFRKKPWIKCYNNAKKHMPIRYESVAQKEYDIKSSLLEDVPVIIGFQVYSSFETKEVAETGVVPMPKPDEKLLGGHCVIIVGYDDSTQRFTCKNSWGEGWGNKGYFTIPYAYLLNKDLAGDFWRIVSST